MTYIDTLTDILAVMLCQYLRSESQIGDTDSAANQTEQRAENVSAGMDAFEYPGADGLVS